MIHVFHALLAKEPNARLLLVGDGPDMKAVRDKVAAMQMEKQVIFQGYCPDVSPFLQAMDVFCFPSVKESFGMASIEAQATGLPVVASTGITTETKLTDHVSFLSLKESADVWADALLKFRSDQRKDQTEKIRQAGYDIQSTAEKMRILYLSLKHGGNGTAYYRINHTIRQLIGAKNAEKMGRPAGFYADSRSKTIL